MTPKAPIGIMYRLLHSFIKEYLESSHSDDQHKSYHKQRGFEFHLSYRYWWSALWYWSIHHYQGSKWRYNFTLLYGVGESTGSLRNSLPKSCVPKLHSEAKRVRRCHVNIWLIAFLSSLLVLQIVALWFNEIVWIVSVMIGFRAGCQSDIFKMWPRI